MTRTDRRQVLKLGAASAASAMLGGSVFACAGVVRRDLAVEPAPAAWKSREVLHSILQDAALAPSSHNSQPWRVVLQGIDRLSLLADPDRRLLEIDPAGLELLLSFGAFVENMVVSAGARGLACRGDVSASTDLLRPIAEITLSKGPTSSYPLDRLGMRCTVREGLRSSELPREAVQALIGADAGRVHFVPSTSPIAASIREATIEAFRQQTHRDSAQRELARWMRFSNEAARAHRDGLTPASLGIRGLTGLIVRLFYGEEDVLKPNFRQRSIDGAASQVQEAGGWFIVTSRNGSPDSILDAGRAFQRVALLTREQGIGLHPMSQALEEEPCRTQLFGRLGVDGIPQFLARAGRVDPYPEPASLRRPVSAFASDTISK